MWRFEATKISPSTVSGWQPLARIDDFAPLSAFHKRLLENGQQQDALRTPNTVAQPGGQLQDQTSSAVHQAFADWSHRGDLLKPVLACGQLADVAPLHLGTECVQYVQPKGSLLGAFWEQQHELQLLQSLFQEPPPNGDHHSQAPPAVAAPESAPEQLLWDVDGAGQPAAAPAPTDVYSTATATAAAAQPAVDALLATGLEDPAGNLMLPPAPREAAPQCFASPFALTDPAAPVQAHPVPLQLPIQLPPEAAGLPCFASPFEGPSLMAPAQQQHARPQQLHAPELLLGYELPGFVTAGSVSHTPRSSSGHLTSASTGALGVVAAAAATVPGDGVFAAACRQQAGADAALLHGQHTDAPSDASMPQSHGSTAAGRPADHAAAAAVERGAEPAAQHVRPFTMVPPWALGSPRAGPGGPCVTDFATAAQLAQAAAAAAALLEQGRLWSPMDVDVPGVGGRGVRRGRVCKGPAGHGAGGKVHSSTRIKMQIRMLQEQHEALMTQFKAEQSLNQILQQRWAQASATYDTQLSHQLQRQATPPASFVAAASAAAAAAATAAVPAGVFDHTGLDALAAAVHNSWTVQLAQLQNTLTILDPSWTKNSSSSQQPAREQGADLCAAAMSGQLDSTAMPMFPEDSLLSPFATATGAAAADAAAAVTGADAGGRAAPGPAQQNAEAAALAALSLPLAACLSSMRAPESDGGQSSPSPTGSDRSESSGGSGSSSSSHGVKRRRGAACGPAGQQVCAELSLLLSSTLSLQPRPKLPKLGGSSLLPLTESDLRLLFASVHSGPEAAGAQQQQGVLGLLSGSLGPSASQAAARLAAATLYDSLWGLFQKAGLVGPSLLYRWLGPHVADCPCCCPRMPAQAAGVDEGGAGQPLTCSMMALLLEGEVGGAPGRAAAGCAGMEAGAGAGNTMAAAAAVTTADGAAPPVPSAEQGVLATPAHWQRVRDCLSLTPGQQAQLQTLWAGLQSAHAPFAAKRWQLVQDLEQQLWTEGGLLGVASYPTCCSGEGTAAVMGERLAGIADSLAADYEVLLESCRLLWGDKSPLTLVQKAKCLVASYPFLPDYGLLECLASGGSSNTTNDTCDAAAPAHA